MVLYIQCFLFAFFLLSGDFKLDPGSDFPVCTLTYISSVLNPIHSFATLIVLILCHQNLDKIQNLHTDL